MIEYCNICPPYTVPAVHIVDMTDETVGRGMLCGYDVAMCDVHYDWFIDRFWTRDYDDVYDLVWRDQWPF